MISVLDLFNVIFYIVLIILVIVLIILGIRAIKTLEKVDKIVDDINYKSSKLDGVFNIIDTTIFYNVYTICFYCWLHTSSNDYSC